MIKEEQIKYLKKNLKFWEYLDEKEKQMIIENVTEVSYRTGQNVHSAEQNCLGMIMIKEGELRTYILSEEGKEITLYRLNSNDICVLSASCVLRNITFDVHIDAEKDTKAFVIDSEVFLKLCENNIYVENFALKITAERFSDVMWAMEQILFMSFDKRLAVFLLDETSKKGSDSLAMTHEQIAKYMGSAREVVSRMLKYFAKEGMVELSRGCIHIKDRKRLKQLL